MNCVQTNLFMPYLCHVNLLSLIMFKTNQPIKETMQTSEIIKRKEKFVNQVDEIFYKIEDMDLQNNILREVLYSLNIEKQQYILNVSKSLLKEDKTKK